jgi:hypothetical protein
MTLATGRSSLEVAVTQLEALIRRLDEAVLAEMEQTSGSAR